MTCSFFTIVNTYFRCCITRDESDITTKNVYADVANGDQSPFTFDDLSQTMISSSSSTSSSSSSLDEYETKPVTTQFQRAQAYKRSHFQPFIGIAPYYSND